MEIDALRVYLLLGLLAHKAVWELMKRRSPQPSSRPPVPLRTKVVKAVKVLILLGIVVQTLVRDVLPIQSDAFGLRVAGAVLFSVGLAVAVLGRLQLGESWSDIETAGVLSNQAVVSVGLYRFIRHPIYTGDLLLLLGLELALNSWGVLLVVGLIPVVLRQAIREERMLMRRLPNYESYCRRTRRFLPFVA